MNNLKNNWTPDDVFKNTDANDVADKVNENTKHKNSKINVNDYTHGLKYDKTDNVLLIETDDGEVVVGGSQQELDDHKDKKVSDTDGVHGIEYVESDGSLMIEKKDGKKIKFESGMNPDQLLKELIDLTKECMEKVGTTSGK